MSESDARLLTRKSIYRGRTIQLDVERVILPNGVTAELDMVRHPGASCVLPVLPDGKLLLIRQFRHAADEVIWEIPAGRLDPGETPEACARRELEEETGMRAATLQRLTTIYTTPGFTDERIHLFLAHGLEEGAHHREADEFMELQTLRWSAVLELVRTGAIQDGKTLTALLFVQTFARG